jgi:hypothetical protein
MMNGKGFGRKQSSHVVLSWQYPGSIEENTQKTLLRIHIFPPEIRTDNLPITSLERSQHESSPLRKPQNLYGGTSSTETSVHACRNTRCAEDGSGVPTKCLMPTCHGGIYRTLRCECLRSWNTKILRVYWFEVLTMSTMETVVFCDALFLNMPS